MPDRVAGDCVSRCGLSHVVTVRITTLSTEPLESEENVGDRWNAQIAISFAEANRIYNRYGILIERGHRQNVSIAQSQQLLTSSSSDQALRRYYDENDEWRRLQQRGILNDRENGEYALTTEVQAILALNRGSSNEACTYWIPEITPWGNTYHSGAFREIENEGIFIEQGVHTDTLAHELGHLLTRAGHDDFVGTPGEGNLPRSNLMWRDSNQREEPRELTDTQVDMMKASQYAVMRDRRRSR